MSWIGIAHFSIRVHFAVTTPNQTPSIFLGRDPLAAYTSSPTPAHSQTLNLSGGGMAGKCSLDNRSFRISDFEHVARARNGSGWLDKGADPPGTV